MLKPGGLFAGYEWLSTAAYNPDNKTQRTIMAEIELGNGLPDVRSIEQVGDSSGRVASCWAGHTGATGAAGAYQLLTTAEGAMLTVSTPSSASCIPTLASSCPVKKMPTDAAIPFHKSPAHSHCTSICFLQCKAALIAAGFEILEEEDIAPTADIPWWEPLDPQRVSVKTFRTTALGRLFTKIIVSVLETLHIAPAGSSRVASFLERAGACCARRWQRSGLLRMSVACRRCMHVSRLACLGVCCMLHVLTACAACMALLHALHGAQQQQQHCCL